MPIESQGSYYYNFAFQRAEAQHKARERVGTDIEGIQKRDMGIVNIAMLALSAAAAIALTLAVRHVGSAAASWSAFPVLVVSAIGVRCAGAMVIYNLDEYEKIILNRKLEQINKHLIDLEERARKQSVRLPAIPWQDLTVAQEFAITPYREAPPPPYEDDVLPSYDLTESGLPGYTE